MSGFTTGMRSSLTDQWATPQYLFDQLDREFHFDLDVCADETNHKCARYFDRSMNGLEQEWTGTCWMNPPYGREIGKWVEKAKLSARGGGGCCLSSPGAPFPSVIAVYGTPRVPTISLVRYAEASE